MIGTPLISVVVAPIHHHIRLVRDGITLPIHLVLLADVTQIRVAGKGDAILHPGAETARLCVAGVGVYEVQRTEGTGATIRVERVHIASQKQ